MCLFVESKKMYNIYVIFIFNKEFFLIINIKIVEEIIVNINM